VCQKGVEDPGKTTETLQMSFSYQDTQGSKAQLEKQDTAATERDKNPGCFILDCEGGGLNEREGPVC